MPDQDCGSLDVADDPRFGSQGNQLRCVDITAHDAVYQSRSDKHFRLAMSKSADDQGSGSHIQLAFDMTIDAQGFWRRWSCGRRADRFHGFAVAFEERLHLIRPVIKFKRSPGTGVISRDG